MTNNEKEGEKSATDEIETFKVGLHPLPRVDATPEEIQEFIDRMPFSEEEREAIQKAKKAIEEEDKKFAEGEA